MGWLDAQRLATALVMPLSLELLLGLIGLALVWRALLGLTARWRVLLVTSAWNLRRAVALFEQAGFEVPPVAADDRSFPSCRALQC